MNISGATEARNKVKRLWLLAFFVGVTESVQTCIYWGSFGDQISKLPLSAEATISLFFLQFLLVGIGWMIIYRCAYRKPGTKYLKFILITSIFSWLGNVLFGNWRFLFPSEFAIKTPVDFAVACAIIIFELATSIFFWVVSYKMHNANSDYKKAVQSLEIIEAT